MPQISKEEKIRIATDAARKSAEADEAVAKVRKEIDHLPPETKEMLKLVLIQRKIDFWRKELHARKD